MQTKEEMNSLVYPLQEPNAITVRLGKNSTKAESREMGSVISLNNEIDSDALILDKIKDGEIDAFEILYKKYYYSLYSYTRKYIDDVEIIKDILQDTFSYVWENRQNIKIEKSLSTYLFRSVHNICINHIRKMQIKERYITDFKLKNVSLTNAYLNSDNGHSRLINSELKNEIDKTIDSLAPQCKRIFILSRVNGLKHKEIAKELSISPKTVESQVFKALKILRDKLKNY